MHPPPWLQNLLHRRVPQFLAAYLGAGLALIPFVGFLIDTYDLPKALLNAVIVAYVSVVPSVFLLAYNHGAPGKDPWILAERVGVPLNLLLTACLLGYTLFSSAPAEATTDTVVITDEAGNAVEHLVPKAKYRRKLAVYFWADESGDASLDWLRYGFPMMLERDLEQNRFLAATTPFNDAMLTRLRRAGYENGLDVPVALQQEIADDSPCRLSSTAVSKPRTAGCRPGSRSTTPRPPRPSPSTPSKATSRRRWSTSSPAG